jgi:hypothetical protein
MNSLELDVYNILKKTRINKIHKTEFGIYNINFNYIDFILVTNNYYICIYTNHLYNNIKNFITEVNILSMQINTRCIGIYFNFFTMLPQQEKIFIDENNKYMNYFINISGTTNNKIINEFITTLYYYGIYCYDNENNCIMLC